MVRRISCWLIVCFGGAVLGSAQSSDLPSPDVTFSPKFVDWTELGPTSLPQEPTVKTRGVPEYSKGRGNGTGRINHLYVPSNRKRWVFACSPTGGLFWSRNKGRNWQVAGTDALPVSGVSAVAVHPRLPRHWILSTGDGDDQFAFTDGVWRTRNAGKTWTNISSEGTNRGALFPAKWIPDSQEPGQWVFISDLVVHPRETHRAFACTSKGLYIAEWVWARFGKVDWQREFEGAVYDVEVHPKDADLVLAGGEKVWISQDGGLKWNQVPDPPVTTDSKYAFVRYSIEASRDAKHLFRVVRTCSEKPKLSAQGESHLLELDTRSQTWRVIRSLKKDVNNVIPTRARAFDVHPLDATRMVAANVQPVYRSEDGGRTFAPIAKGQMHDDVHHLLYHPKGEILYAAHDGGVSWSQDGGKTFAPRDEGIGAANVFGFSLAETPEVQILYGGYDTGGNLLKDGKWRHVSWGDGFQTITDHRDPNQLFATKQSGHIDASDDGLLFDRKASSTVGQSEWHTWIRQNPNGSAIYASGNVLGRSTDGGNTWEPLLDPSTLQPDFKNCYRMYTCPGHPEVLYVYILQTKSSKAALVRTFNVLAEHPEDVQWEVVDLPREFWISALAISPTDPKNCWVSYKHGKGEAVLWALQHGKWEGLEGVLDPEERIGSMLVEPGDSPRLFIGTAKGIWTLEQTASGRQWQYFDGLPGCLVTGMAFNRARQTLVVSTFGRGMWEAPTNSFVP